MPRLLTRRRVACRTLSHAAAAALLAAAPAAAGQGRGPVRLKLMTYNIKGSQLRSPAALSRVARFIERDAPDIVALQEVKNFLRFDQADVIARLAGYTSLFGEARHKFPGLGEGVAVLVRRRSSKGLRIRAWANVALPKAPGAPSKDLRRNAVVVDLELPGCGSQGPEGALRNCPEPSARGRRRLRIVATHLSHNHEPSRVAQARRLVELIRGPTLLMGDLNARPGSAPMRVVGARLADVFAAARPGAKGYTVPSRNATSRIDYILANTGKPLGARVRGAPGEPLGGLSDHRAVIAEIELP